MKRVRDTRTRKMWQLLFEALPILAYVAIALFAGWGIGRLVGYSTDSHTCAVVTGLFGIGLIVLHEVIRDIIRDKRTINNIKKM